MSAAALSAELAGIWSMAAPRRLPGVAATEARGGPAADPAPAARSEPTTPPAARRSGSPGLLEGMVFTDHWSAQGLRISAALAEGAERRPCHLGGLALVRPDGREFWVSPRGMAGLGSRRTLPDELLHGDECDE